MKNVYILLLLVLSATGLQAQTDVYFKIHHFIGDLPFENTVVGNNNLNNQFSIDRLEYYVSTITVAYNNGLDTTFNESWILANGEQTVDFYLGNWDVDSITEVQFSIGIQQDYNHLDPATYPSTHPLALKSPSMHWGWASGYRFVALEGKCGTNLDRTFELHALGDANYFRNYIKVKGERNGTSMSINIKGDYENAMKSIDLSGDLIYHGEANEAVTLLSNFSRGTFSFYENAPTAVSELSKDTKPVKLFPNPVQSNSTIRLINIDPTTDLIEIYNLEGRSIRKLSQNFGEISTNNLAPGTYFIRTISQEKTLSLHKLIIVK